MGARLSRLRREHSPERALRMVARGLPLLGALACLQDDAAPVPQRQVTPPAPPIVDMSPSAQRPMLLAETPVVFAEPAVAPAPRPVPARDAAVVSAGDVAALRERRLIVPVAGVTPAELVGSFREARGSRVHEALDISAPRGTPVLAAGEGKVLKLFTSREGGLTIYVADVSKKFIYYYAHLDAYALALAEGQAVAKGQQLGTVGTTGNAPPGTPHLHFAILRSDDVTKWWLGTPIDPYTILR